MQSDDFCEEISELTGTLMQLCQKKERILLQGAEITSVELHALQLLSGRRSTMHQLAEQLELSPSRVTRVVDSLFNKQLLIREQNPDDRRLCQVTITNEGMERLRQGKEVLHRFQEQVAGFLDEKDKEVIITSLSRFLSAFQQGIGKR